MAPNKGILWDLRDGNKSADRGHNEVLSEVIFRVPPWAYTKIGVSHWAQTETLGGMLPWATLRYGKRYLGLL